jgi:hypothetical protein
MRKALGLLTLGVAVTMGTAVPAGAQQLVDAAGEGGGGGLAFVLMAAMVMLIAAALFFMDRVRRRAQARDESTTP